MHQMRTFDEFWPFYLREHAKPATRALHLAGTSLALVLFGAAIVSSRLALLFAALICGYLFAWIGHFFVEHNRPATFRHPLWSFRADFRMWGCAVTGRLGRELDRAGVS